MLENNKIGTADLVIGDKKFTYPDLRGYRR
jgi:hypothetical protein